MSLCFTLLDKLSEGAACLSGIRAELRQCPVGGQPWDCIKPKICAMSAPGIFLGHLHNAGSNGVEMDIAGQLHKVGIRIDQHSLEPALEKMTAAAAPPVDPAGVPESDVLHDAGQMNFSNLDRQVDVGGHEAEGMDAMPVTCSSFLQKQIEAITVGIFKEDVLAAVAAQHHVVHSSRIVDSWFSCHTPDKTYQRIPLMQA